MMDRLISALMALSLAFLVWLYMRSRDQETLDNIPIPVQIVLTSSQAEQYELDVDGSSEVPFSFTGPPSRLRELRGMLHRREVRVDVTLAVPEDRQGESHYRDTVRVSANDVHVPPGVTPAVVEGKNRIPVTLHHLVTRKLKVKVDQNVEDRLGDVAVEPASVLVHGPQEVLDRNHSISTQPYSLPPHADAPPGQEVATKTVVHLVQEMDGRPVKPMPSSVILRVTVKPMQKVYEMTDVPVRFLCPPNFNLRPRFLDERGGKINLRVKGPTGDTPPAVIAYIDLTSGKFESGLYGDEPLRLQLPKDCQLAHEAPKPPSFELVRDSAITINGK